MQPGTNDRGNKKDGAAQTTVKGRTMSEESKIPFEQVCRWRELLAAASAFIERMHDGKVFSDRLYRRKADALFVAKWLLNRGEPVPRPVVCELLRNDKTHLADHLRLRLEELAQK
jgi:hypothetical protein